jgi:excisionase family DNA binding protein
MSEPSAYITVAEAREILGVSKPHMTALLKRGVLHAEPDPVDRRVKRLVRAEVEALARQSAKVGKDAA